MDPDARRGGRSRRARRRSCRSTSTASWPTWTRSSRSRERHGLAHRRGRRAGPRRDVPRPAGRPVRAGDVQPLRDEEPDDRRGRLRHDRRRRARRPPPALPEPRDARPLPPRRLGTNFKPTDLAAAHRPGPARPARRADRAAPAQRRPPHRGPARLPDPGVPDGREHAWHQYTMRFPGERDARGRRPDGARHRDAHLLPGPGAPAGLPAGVSCRAPPTSTCPVTNRLSDEVLSIPVRPNLAAEELEAVIAAIREVATPVEPAVAPALAADRRGSRLMAAPLRVGLAGLGSMGRNHLRHLVRPRGLRPRRRRRPGRRRARRRRRQDRRRRLRRPARDDRGGRARRRRHRRADDDARAARRWRRSSAACRSSSRSRSRPRWRRGSRSSRPPGPRGVPLQVGHVERFNPAVLELGRRIAKGWVGTLYSITSRRAGPVPGPDPRRRRDDRPRHPRRRHPLVGRRRAADAGLRRDRPAAARHERGPPVRAAPLPVGRDRHARRQLAHAGEAAPAHGGRRGRACSSSTT